MPENEQRDAVTRVAPNKAQQSQATDEITAEQEWCRLAGFTRTEWQRLVFTRWRHRQGELTEYPEGSGR